MYISFETEDEKERRLREVIKKSTFKVYAGTYYFEEFALKDFSKKANENALALVRDEEVWSQLVPSTNEQEELFVIFSFHFDGHLDNSGFVGWLANYLKEKLGTGVFVTCGQNKNKGGIFDYWGCPSKLGSAVLKELKQLMALEKEKVLNV
ncbi:MAG: hypothetical protein HRT43_11480 [Campylobacteraceae bacterium]|nr:hypothetical protein [Campylobacteraceae bacterium]